MTSFLHWRKTTWAFVLWNGYIAAWTVITGPGPAMVALWWLAGMIVLGSLLFAKQPLFQQGPGLTACSLARLDGRALRQPPPNPRGEGQARCRLRQGLLASKRVPPARIELAHAV